MSTPSELSQPLERVSRPFRVLILAAAGAIFALITVGVIVRVTESGLGCPDWPLCHGRFIPPFEYHTLLEYSHRLVASIAGALVVFAAFVAWRRYRAHPWIVRPLVAAVPLVGVAGLLGRQAVLTELSPTVVIFHLAVAEVVFALLMVAAVSAWRPTVVDAITRRSLSPWVKASLLATFLVMLSGSYVVGRSATAVCPDWPLCGGAAGGLLPAFELEWVHMAHRLLSAGVGLLIAWAALLSWRRRSASPAVGSAGLLIVAALLAQTLAGAANPWSGFATAARVVHLSLATALWGSLVLLVTLLWSTGATGAEAAPAPTRPGRERGPLRGIVADYIALTKPRIILMLLVTALGGMFLATRGLPSFSLMALVFMGGALGAGGANALNHYFDRDIDEVMHRTRRRPVPGHRVKPGHALTFGVLLNVAAFVILATWVNLLAASLTLGATLFYVLVYTLWLKRSTTQNIVIGGAAGAVPPLVGWAAVTGGLDLPAVYLFAIVFFWTPPHFWALALLLKDDYARATVPMLPVVRGVPETARSIMLHTIVLVAITILFFTIQALGWLYLAAAVLLGAGFLFLAWRLLRVGGVRVTRQLYLYSLLYLAAIFVAVMVDSSLTL